MKSSDWKIGVIVCLLLCLLATCQSVDPNAPVFEIKSYNKEDQINIRIVESYALAEISSQSGIGQAVIALQAGKISQKLIFRLYLKGLENFRLIYGQNSITLSITSTGNHEVRQAVSKNSSAAENLNPESTYWMPLQIVATGGADKRIPLQSGYFELEAPKDFVLNAGQSFTIQWIDFYR